MGQEMMRVPLSCLLRASQARKTEAGRQLTATLLANPIKSLKSLDTTSGSYEEVGALSQPLEDALFLLLYVLLDKMEPRINNGSGGECSSSSEGGSGTNKTGSSSRCFFQPFYDMLPSSLPQHPSFWSRAEKLLIREGE